MVSAIYKIVNLINGKFYIGSAVNLDRRWKKHKYELKQNRHHSPHLQSAYNKYGDKAFKLIILQKIFKIDDLEVCEQIWIDILKPYLREIGYNIRMVTNSNRGLKFTDEHKRKIGDANKGRVMPEYQKEKLRNIIISTETRKKRSIAHTGKILTEETKTKMSKFQLNRTHSKSHNNNISKALKGRRLTPIIGRDISKWPHKDGARCKCEECMKKKRDLQTERYKRKKLQK